MNARHLNKMESAETVVLVGTPTLRTSHTNNTRREMKKELLNVLFYTLAGLIFLSVFLTVAILFLPYYLIKGLVDFYQQQKGET